MGFGQVVVGPPGSGKSTYCRGMHEFLSRLGRAVSIVNLDPANEEFVMHQREDGVHEAAGEGLGRKRDEKARCSCADISELVRVEEVMEELQLGPNGAMLYCLEFLEHNVEWLEAKLREEMEKARFTYFLFDLPGQIELSTHHSSVRNIMQTLQKRLDLRLTAVHLVDAHHCADPSKYISAVFLSLSTMLRLELPHVNVLSKIDLIESDGTLPFNLDFYTGVMDLEYLIPHLPSHIRSRTDKDKDPSLSLEPPSKFDEKFKRLNAAIADLIDQYSLVSFKTLNIQDKESVAALVKHIDKTNGFADVLGAQQVHGYVDDFDTMAIQEKYMSTL